MEFRMNVQKENVSFIILLRHICLKWNMNAHLRPEVLKCHFFVESLNGILETLWNYFVCLVK